MNIVLFGAPGSGKGTQSALLVEKKNYKHFSTGDLFRAAIKNGTELGKLAKGILDKGQLVPDEITIGLVKEVLRPLMPNKNGGGESFVLDGFPRNIAQADALENLLKELHLKLDKTIFLEVDKDLLKRRLTGRRVCKSCGAVFHVDSKPTKKEGVCDVCGGQVVQRPDDMPDVIENRLNVYNDSTAPLKKYYKQKGLLVEVDGTGSQNQVFDRVAAVLK